MFESSHNHRLFAICIRLLVNVQGNFSKNDRLSTLHAENLILSG